ncbi:hypothetical protein OG782_13170 [Streptomyces sp. NBC_00876]|uniref:hypothetical protein n=1 Tax=Streptomyces sp. NBC_00876 TaxID=2975853 RepID=UPI003863A948|nr:hypothetical protein OG782_13170 [Streptomyces sp. NBC_00876]
MSVRIRIRIRAREHAGALAVTAALVGVLAGCTEATTSQGPGGDVPYVAPSVNAEAAEKGVAQAEADARASEAADANAEVEAAVNGPVDVRDAFAGLQATREESCTPGAGNCAYLLGRVNEELARLDKSMRAGNDGPSHFKQPLAWMGALRTTLAGNTDTANLEKHYKDLIGTRERVNTWMQGHPEDYR